MRAALLCGLLAMTGCAKGTFVLLDFTTGPVQPAKTLACSLVLGGKTASTTFTAKGSAFTFPTTSSLEIQSGFGSLAVDCQANDASGASVGTASGTVNVVRDQTVSLSLSFTGMVDGGVDAGPSILVIAPTSYDFGVTVIGTTSPAYMFTVTNDTSSPTDALAVSIDGTDASDFTFDSSGCSGKMLAVKASCTVTVQLAPSTTTANGMKSAALHVGAAGGMTVTAMLSGTAGTKGALSFADATYAFPATLAGMDSPPSTFTLTNTGSTPTTAITVMLSGSNAADFVITSDSCAGQSLGGNATCTITAHVTPSMHGALSASLSAVADTGGTAVEVLTGVGQLPATLAIVSATSQASPFEFGVTTINTTSTTPYNFTVTNNGDATTGTLVLSTAATSTGAVPSELAFTSNTTCVMGTTTLAAGASCVVELAFTPATFGEKDYTFTVSATPGGSQSTYAAGQGRDYVGLGVHVITSGASSGMVTDDATPSDFSCTMTPSDPGCSHVFARTTTPPPTVNLTAAPTTGHFSTWDAEFDTGHPPCTQNKSSATCSIVLDATTFPGKSTSAAAAGALYVMDAAFSQ